MRRPAIPLKTALTVASGPLVCYFLMALSRGWFYLPVSGGPTLLRPFFLTRYLDGIFIVPAALFTLLWIALTASAERDREWHRLMPSCTGVTVTATLFAACWDPVVKTLLYVPPSACRPRWPSRSAACSGSSPRPATSISGRCGATCAS